MPDEKRVRKNPPKKRDYGPFIRFKNRKTMDVSMPSVIEWAPGLRWMSCTMLGSMFNMTEKCARAFCMSLGVPVCRFHGIDYVRYEFLLLIVATISTPGQPLFNNLTPRSADTHGNRYKTDGRSRHRGGSATLQKRLGYDIGPQYEARRLQLLAQPATMRLAVHSVQQSLRVLGFLPDHDIAPNLVAAFNEFVDFFTWGNSYVRHPKYGLQQSNAAYIGNQPDVGIPQSALNQHELDIYRVWGLTDRTYLDKYKDAKLGWSGPGFDPSNPAHVRPACPLGPDGTPCASGIEPRSNGGDGPDPHIPRPVRNRRGAGNTGRGASGPLPVPDRHDEHPVERLQNPVPPAPSPEGTDGANPHPAEGPRPAG